MHTAGSLELALFAAGTAVFLLAVCSNGPLGAVRFLHPSLHRALDIVVASGLALSPLIARGHLDLAAVIVAECVAVVLARLLLSTRYEPSFRHRDSAPTASETSVPDGTAREEGTGRGQVVSTPMALGAYAAHRAREYRRPAAAESRRRQRQRLLEEGARRLGASVGRARRGSSH